MDLLVYRDIPPDKVSLGDLICHPDDKAAANALTVTRIVVDTVAEDGMSEHTWELSGRRPGRSKATYVRVNDGQLVHVVAPPWIAMAAWRILINATQGRSPGEEKAVTLLPTHEWVTVDVDGRRWTVQPVPPLMADGDGEDDDTAL